MAAKTFIGGNQVKKIYLGGTEIKKVYAGNNLVYQNKPEPITRDIANSSFTVPAGYTSCSYIVFAEDIEMGMGSDAAFYKNGVEISRVSVNFGQDTESGTISVISGDVLGGSGSGVSYSVFITLT